MVSLGAGFWVRISRVVMLELMVRKGGIIGIYRGGRGIEDGDDVDSDSVRDEANDDDESTGSVDVGDVVSDEAHVLNPITEEPASVAKV